MGANQQKQTTMTQQEDSDSDVEILTFEAFEKLIKNQLQGDEEGQKQVEEFIQSQKIQLEEEENLENVSQDFQDQCDQEKHHQLQRQRPKKKIFGAKIVTVQSLISFQTSHTVSPKIASIIRKLLREEQLPFGRSQSNPSPFPDYLNEPHHDYIIQQSLRPQLRKFRPRRQIALKSLIQSLDK